MLTFLEYYRLAGQTLKLYHGSPIRDLSVLKPNKTGVLFLTDNPEAAEFHAMKMARRGQSTEIGMVYVVNVTIENPRFVGNMGYDGATSKTSFVQQCKSEGYDAIISSDEDSYAIFTSVRPERSYTLPWML